MAEASLGSQTATLGEAMRSYRSFGLPGIDMLCAWFEYTTAKQAQSAVHQYGREGMVSELYGVTNWDFDFRGHKLQGDWQAALGVTVRVPHLSWVSMAGEAKRDYPASINYQSPWWQKYSVIENHFSRLNTALTRGKPIVRVGMIHPVESYWLHWGPAEQTALVRENMEVNFQNVTRWLLFGGIDFDFISESLLPDLCDRAEAPLKVGKMEYDVVIVPECETLRTTTLECLEGFAAAGGQLIFMGALPVYENALPSQRGQALAQRAQCISFNRGALLQALEQIRLVEIRNETGALTDTLLHQIRQDGRDRWLFVAHGAEPYNKDISRYQDLRIRVVGHWKASLFNTMDGSVECIDQCIEGDVTEVYCRMYDYDSILLKLEPADAAEMICVNTGALEDGVNIRDEEVADEQEIELPCTVPYTLSESNVLLLDQAEYALDDGMWMKKEEILRLDDICREELGWPSRKYSIAQPWAIEEESITHKVHLRWHIYSEIAYIGAKIAIEDAEQIEFKWNESEIANTVTGWYVDKAIKTVNLPPLQKGMNILEAVIPFGKRTNLEWAYLLGNFGVEVTGGNVKVVALRQKIAFGNITSQGLPFYGGNITYHVPVETEGGKLRVRSSRYRGVMQSVSVDGDEEMPMIYPPYTVEFEKLAPGRHTINITLYGHRRNSFGPVHLTDLQERWIGPDAWRTEGEKWSYDYILCEEGILVTPEIMEEYSREDKNEEGINLY